MNKVLLSSKKMDWCTPVDFFNKLNKKFHFVLDPAATDKTAKCPLVRGRLRFTDEGVAGDCAPFPSMVVVYNPTKEAEDPLYRGKK